MGRVASGTVKVIKSVYELMRWTGHKSEKVLRVYYNQIQNEELADQVWGEARSIEGEDLGADGRQTKAQTH